MATLKGCRLVDISPYHRLSKDEYRELFWAKRFGYISLLERQVGNSGYRVRNVVFLTPEQILEMLAVKFTIQYRETFNLMEAYETKFRISTEDVVIVQDSCVGNENDVIRVKRRELQEMIQGYRIP